MRKFALVLTSVSTLGIAASTAQAQSVGDLAGWVALSSTPVGALSSTVSNSMLGRSAKGYEMAGRFGHMSLDGGVSFNTFGVSGSMPVSGFTLGGTLGYLSPSCPAGSACDGNMMVGLNAETRLGEMAISDAKKNPNKITVGLRSDFGWAKPDEVTALSLSAGVPVALVARNGNMTFAPFITPGLGWGRLSDAGVSESGTRFHFGAGLGMLNANGWGVSVGMQKVFIEQGKTTFGLNVSYGK
jgi:hypothetical protein